jgi:hypothetical protein
MRYTELVVDGNIIKSQNEIHKQLLLKKFYWLLDSEIENAEIEIRNDTLIWHSGDFYSGDWEYGIFKSGNFYGNFINGIFENGNFKGRWNSGINLQSEKI